MKTIFSLVALVLLASCASIKKTTTKSVVTSDSVATHRVDSTTKTVAVQKNSQLSTYGLRIRVVFDTGAVVGVYVPAAVKKTSSSKSQPVDQEVADAIASINSGHSQIREIDISADSTRDLVDYSNKIDTKAVTRTDSVGDKKSASVVVSTVSKLRIPTGLLIGGAILLLVLLALCLVKKFKIL
jgi:hypothetical protein